MYNEASFRLIGRIAKMQRVGGAIKVNVANNFDVKGDDGKYEEKTTYNQVTVFGKQAEWVENKRKVGDLVLVEGNLHDSQYQDKNGETVYTVERNANRFELLTSAPAKKED